MSVPSRLEIGAQCGASLRSVLTVRGKICQGKKSIASCQGVMMTGINTVPPTVQVAPVDRAGGQQQANYELEHSAA